MTVPVVAFFNNKGGVGKTSVVYHLAWMMESRRLRVVAADLDPQANLTAVFLDEKRSRASGSATTARPGDGPSTAASSPCSGASVTSRRRGQ